MWELRRTVLNAGRRIEARRVVCFQLDGDRRERAAFQEWFTLSRFAPAGREPAAT